MQKLLPSKTYLDIIKNTPLVSIDLIISDDSNRIMLGRRINEPASGLLFVPGGRILKNESMSEAITRIANTELRTDVTEVEFHGVYEHIYDNNYFNKLFSTHYVVIALTCKYVSHPIILDQHDEIIWLSIDDILERNDVHQFVKNYFISGTGITGHKQKYTGD